MPAIPAIQSAEAFITLMKTIWDDDPADLYNEWHNARKVADEIGACKLHGTKRDGVSLWTYRMPDNSQVLISTDGAQVMPMKHYRPENYRPN